MGSTTQSRYKLKPIDIYTYKKAVTQSSNLSKSPAELDRSNMLSSPVTHQNLNAHYENARSSNTNENERTRDRRDPTQQSKCLSSSFISEKQYAQKVLCSKDLV